ncbi:MAG: hypothetical protein LC794_01950 [Acidobacteria bacterium]|nr:hypothetical protein [Acidobacteriota bacterium]
MTNEPPDGGRMIVRGLNGPNFTWPLLMFSGARSEKTLQRISKIYRGKPLKTKNRAELLASLKAKDWQYLRADNGEMPTAHISARAAWSGATIGV